VKREEKIGALRGLLRKHKQADIMTRGIIWATIEDLVKKILKGDFEIWAKTKELDLTSHSKTKKSDFDYCDIQTQMFWECWQSAITKYVFTTKESK